MKNQRGDYLTQNIEPVCQRFRVRVRGRHVGTFSSRADAIAARDLFRALPETRKSG
jgi:hypothetical protein